MRRVISIPKTKEPYSSPPQREQRMFAGPTTFMPTLATPPPTPTTLKRTRAMRGPPDDVLRDFGDEFDRTATAIGAIVGGAGLSHLLLDQLHAVVGAMVEDTTMIRDTAFKSGMYREHHLFKSTVSPHVDGSQQGVALHERL